MRVGDGHGQRDQVVTVMTRFFTHLGVVVLICAAKVYAGDLAAVTERLLTQAQNGNFDSANAASAMREAGATDAEVKQYLGDFSKAFLDSKKSQDAKDQNASGTADWNLDRLERETTYKFSFPLENNCRIGQTVAITYPEGTFGATLSGPDTVEVPAKGKVDVPLTLVTVGNTDVPVPPWPIGQTWECVPVLMNIAMTHAQAQWNEKTPAGTYTHTCDAMKRTYSVYAHVHIKESPNPGGGPGKKKPSPCAVLWSTGRFYATPDHPTRESCRDEMKSLAHHMLDTEVAPLASQSPALWRWMVPGSVIDDMSVDSLVGLRQHAQHVAVSGQ